MICYFSVIAHWKSGLVAELPLIAEMPEVGIDLVPKVEGQPH